MSAEAGTDEALDDGPDRNTGHGDRPVGDGNPGAEPDDGDSADERDEGLQVRLENSRRGQALISVLVVATLAVILSVNMPASELRNGLLVVAQPVANAVGLDQGWAVFAPNPRGQSGFLTAQITERDGRIVPYPVPVQRGFAEYWDYRWQRFGESALFDPKASSSWAPYCRWVAEQDRAAGGSPVRCTLTSRAAVTLPPGTSPARAPWVDKTFYTIGLAP